MQTYPKQRGFTLIEILVATAIFATVMIIVVATFSWAAGYNNRLKETRRVGQEVRSAMDDMTKNIRLANGSGKLILSSSTADIGEITLLNCSKTATSTCVLVGQNNPIRYKNDLTSADPSNDAPVSNAILILQQNNKKAILYRQIPTSGVNYELSRAEQDVASWPASINLITINSQAVSLHPEDKMSMQLWSGGYGSTKASKNQQSYAEIYLIGKTFDYDKLQPNLRSRFHLRTMIETRDYNP